MGPGCFYPGNVDDREYKLAYSLLQWGRDVSIPEMSLVDYGVYRVKLLQWGRDVSIPEIPGAGLVTHGLGPLQWGRDVSIPEMQQDGTTWQRLTCFNGAGMFLSRK